MSNAISPVDENLDSVNQDETPKSDLVKYDTYKRVLNEKKARDAELREAKAVIEKYETEKRSFEESTLREKEDWRKLFEQRESELKTTKLELDSIKTRVVDSKKLNSFLNAIEKPIEQKYWSLVELDKIVVDPNSGEIDSSTLKNYAEEFKKEYWKVIDSSTPKMPNENHNNKPNGITYDYWLTLKPNEQKKRLKDII